MSHKLLTFTLLSLSIFSQSHAMDGGASVAAVIKGAAVMRSLVCHGNDGKFSILNPLGAVCEVKKYNVSKNLRDRTPAEIAAYVAAGSRLLVKATEDGYVIKGYTPGKGGGPFAGAVAYGVTKALCWGGLIGAATAGIAATGGAGVVAGGLLAEGAGLAGLAGGGAALGAAGVAAAGAEGAVAAGAAGLAGAGGAAAVVGGIETASFAAGAFFTAIPFLP